MTEDSPAPGGRVTNKTGQAAFVPTWLIGRVPGRALELYVILAGEAIDYGTGETKEPWSRARLAERLGCSVRTVQAALNELVDAQALERIGGTRNDGGQGAYDYVIDTTRPELREPAGASASSRTGGVQEVALPSLQSANQKPLASLGTQAQAQLVQLGKVNRKQTTAEETRLAVEVLSSWNRQNDDKLMSHDWLRMIIMRLREHPELSLQQHEEIIAATLRAKWWKGESSPSLVYGNGAQFERAMKQVNARDDSSGASYVDELEQVVKHTRRS